MFYTFTMNLIVGSSIMAGLLTILILIIKYILKNRISARLHYILWFVLIIRLMIPYIVYSPLNISDLFDEQHALQSSATTGTVDMSDNLSNPNEINTSNKPNTNIETSQEVTQPVSIGNSFKQLFLSISQIEINYKLIFLIWILGVGILGLYTILYNIYFWTKVKNGSIFTDQKVIQILEECKQTLSIPTNISIIQTSGISIPAIFGVMRPWLLLPEKVLKTLEYENLRYVILHELAHLKRRDVLINWIVFVLQIIHWFNPFIWLAFGKMRVDRELACDEVVLNHLEQGEIRKYGHTILDMVEIVSGSVSYAGIAGVLEDKSQITDRILMISQFAKRNRKLSLGGLIIAILLSSSILVNAADLTNKSIYNETAININSVDESISDSSLEAKTVAPAATMVPASTPVPADEETSAPAQTIVSEPVDVTSIISDSKAVSEMLKIKEGETMELSDISPSMRGAVTKTSSTPQFYNDSYASEDVILIYTIGADKKLEYGEECMMSFELVYNNKSSDTGVILVGFNAEDYANATYKALWAIPKGSGVLVFNIPVAPRRWLETPFSVSAGIIDLASSKPLPVGYTVNLLPSDADRITINE